MICEVCRKKIKYKTEGFDVRRINDVNYFFCWSSYCQDLIPDFVDDILNRGDAL